MYTRTTVGKIARYISLSVAMFSLAGCHQPNILADCGHLWTKEKLDDVSLIGSTTVHPSYVDTSTIMKIAECYRQRPIGDTSHALRYGQELKLKNGQRVLLFSVDGLSDVEVAATISENDSIIKIGLVSTNY